MGDLFTKVLEKPYGDMHAYICNNLESKDFGYLQMSAEGNIARITKEKEIEIDLGVICYSREPLSFIIQELKDKIDQIAHEIDLIKLKFSELIEMAGDISPDEQQSFLPIAEAMACSQEEEIKQNLVSIPQATDGIESIDRVNISKLENLISAINEKSIMGSCKFKLELKKSEIREFNEIRTGSLSLSIELQNEEIKQLQRDFFYNEVLLKIYSSLCIEESLPNNEKLLKYNKNHAKGIAIKVIADSYKVQRICEG